MDTMENRANLPEEDLDQEAPEQEAPEREGTRTVFM